MIHETGTGAAEASSVGRGAPAETAPGPRELSAFPKRVVEVFFSPGVLMEGLARTPVWGAAFVLGMVLVLAQTLLIPAELWESMMREQMIAQGQDPSVFRGGATIVRVFGLVGATIGYLMMTMLFTGLITLTFAFVLGDEGRFRQYLATVSHAFLIPGVVGLLLVPLRIVAEDPRLTLNLGTFLTFLPEGYLLRLATLLDLATLWAWVVVAMGARAIDPRRSLQSAATALIALFVGLMALLALLPTAA